MDKEKPTISHCPNCQQPAIRTGNEIFCEQCDTTFTITQKQGATVKQIGPIDELRGRIEKLEQLQLLPGEHKPAKQEPEPTDEEEII
jgi:uncharacterized Zn finger protein (UPF0148 family)